MKQIPLGQTGLHVSQLGLGSMTWGNRNTESEGHAQIDMALDHGVNFIDTAEMYPVNPIAAETVGRTEDIIGSWIAKSGRRDDIVLATKVTGQGQSCVRNGAPISRDAIVAAVEGSLARLKTDVIDLYQLHWPNRGSYHFRQHWGFDPTRQNGPETAEHMAEVMETLAGLVQAGKIRHFGLSNESTWGTAQWIAAAKAHGGPRPQAIQNEYSLLCRIFDTDLAELCAHEQVTLLAFSPLATGLLSGKYAGDVTPAGSRRENNPLLGGRITPRLWPAVQAYCNIADRHGLDPSQMALAWCCARPVPTVPIFGATSLAQLKCALGAADLTLSAAVLSEIDAAHRAHPLPF